MELDRIHSAAAHVEVADSIRRWIALGLTVPGDRLPSERELAEQLGVGRMTVRQAIRILAEEGLVSTQRGRSGGTFVLEGEGQPLGPSEITEQMIKELDWNYEFRLSVEPLAARLAAQRASETERWAIRGLAEGGATGVRAFRALDSRFHIAVANASHNPRIVEAVSRSRTEFFTWADRAWERTDWEAVSEADRDLARRHRPIAEAIIKGDPEQSAQRMVDHLSEGREQFMALIGRLTAAQKSALTVD